MDRKNQQPNVQTIIYSVFSYKVIVSKSPINEEQRYKYKPEYLHEKKVMIHVTQVNDQLHNK